MKELSIEEKAKAYDRALEIAKAWCKLDNNDLSNDDLKTLFPELNESKESEYDEIRKELLEIFKENKGSIYISLAPRIKSFLISLLEKKGGQNDSDVKDYNSIDPHFGKSIDKIEPNFNFKAGQWIVATGKCVYLITKIDGFNVTLVDVDGNEYVFDTSSLEDAHLWTIDDAKDGDIICVKNAPFIYKHHDSRYFYTYCTLNFEGEFLSLTPLCWDIVTYSGEIFPATKEQRDFLFSKMNEAGYEWDADKKELNKIEDEEYNGDDYGIDGLWHAMNILEKTLGKVSGYQTDDGFLSHQMCNYFS